MAGFVDFLRMITGWWSSRAVTPRGEITPAVWLSVPGDRTFTADSESRTLSAEPGTRGWLAETKEE